MLTQFIFSEIHQDETLELDEATMSLLEKKPFIPVAMVYTIA